jgi:hypothetical protein
VFAERKELNNPSSHPYHFTFVIFDLAQLPTSTSNHRCKFRNERRGGQSVYSPGLPGYTIEWVGFRLSPINPILLKPPWIRPILAQSRKGGALFFDRIVDFGLPIADLRGHGAWGIEDGVKSQYPDFKRK